MKITSINFILFVFMLIASGLGFALKPTNLIADDRPRVDLETMIPKEFGDWKIDSSIIPLLVSPDVQEKLDAIYNQVLARTYINSQNKRVMLSIAYGSNQSNDNYQAHRPEYCYIAQGFRIKAVNDDLLATPAGEFPIRRLEAFLGNRHEPITYWMLIGDRAILPGLDRKLAQLRYGLTGQIPDGMLVRISSIMNDNEEAYRLQEHFISKLLLSVEPNLQPRIIGNVQ